MRIFEIINEALKPSEYRPYVKGWDKAKWNDIFDGKYRLYIPLIGSAGAGTEIDPNPKVADALASVGFIISDYAKGLATKSDSLKNTQYKIGKIIADPRFEIDPSIKSLFDNDPARASVKTVSDDLLVVISRHPYDVAGMSTDRGWSSCMNLRTGINKEYVAMDVKYGTLVAYLIHKDDTNIKSPIARMLIKPFVNVFDPSEVAFGVENKVYGTAPVSFAKTVVDWADSMNEQRKLNGVYMFSPNLYLDNDSTDPVKVVGNIADTKSETAEIKKVIRDGLAIQNIKNPSERVQLAAVNQNGNAIQYIKNSSEQVQLAAVNRSGNAIWHINNPSEQVQLAAVKQNGNAIGYIENPAPSVLKLYER